MTDLQWFFFGLPQAKYLGQARRISRRKAVALAAYLLGGNGPQNRERLAQVLWPDLSQEQARTALRGTLPVLTALSAESWLEASRQHIGVDDRWVWSDTGAFIGLLEGLRLHHHDPGQLCGGCLAQLERGVELYRGDFLEGFWLEGAPEFSSWAAVQREWLRREYGQMLHALSQHHALGGRLEQAVAYAQRWVGLEPLDEAAQRLLIRLLAQNGQRAEAVRQYRACVALLEAELSSPPEEETVRLYQAIQDNRAVVSPGARLEPAAVLPRLPPLLVGREAELIGLRKRLGIGGERQAVTVVEGWPGVGKSTIAAFLAHDEGVAQAFPDGVLWASLGENPDRGAKLTLWADSLHLADPSRNRTLDELAYQLRAALRDRRVLIVVDDVWRLEDALPFLVGGKACATLLTSRLGAVAAELAPAASDIYRLDTLDEAGGLELLEQISPKTVRDHPQAARELVRSLEGLPLAIQVAGRLLRSEARLGRDAGELLAELRRGVGLLEAPLPGDLIRSGSEIPGTTTALFRRSTDGLDDLTLERFVLLSLFPPKPASFDLAAVGAIWGVTNPKPTLRVLLDRGLLEAIPVGRFQMHTLLALHAQTLLPGQASLEQTFRQRHKQHYLGLLDSLHRALFGVGQPEALAAVRRELEHLRQAWLWAVESRDEELLEPAASSLSLFVTHTGHLILGAELFAPAAAQVWASPKVQVVLNGVYGWVQILLGQAAEGEARMRREVERLQQQRIGGSVASLVYSCLGSWHVVTGRLAEAEALYEHSLQAIQAQPDPDSDWARVQLEGFWAGLELAKGHLKTALRRVEAALRLTQTVRDGVQSSWVRSVQAEILLRQGQTAEAEALIKANWRYFREVDNRWGAVTALKTLGLLADRRGQNDIALDYLGEALEAVAQVGDHALRLEIGEHIARLQVKEKLEG